MRRATRCVCRCGHHTEHDENCNEVDDSPHLVAQKLIITTRPRCSASRMFGPTSVRSVKSGAALDGETAGRACPVTSASALPAEACSSRRRVVSASILATTLFVCACVQVIQM
jgi:hypothetical protein